MARKRSDIMINKTIFQHKNQYTIGVEEEYMLCNPNNGELINKADDIFKIADENLQKRLSYELICSEIETNTRICKNSFEAIKQVQLLRKKIRDIGHNFPLIALTSLNDLQQSFHQ